MSKLLEYLRLCRLCLVKDNVNVPIFADSSDVRQIFLKISACLPIKVSQDDNLPKHICDNCLYKVDLLYQFWNTTVHAEKQLIEWFTELGIDVNTKNKDSSVHMIAQSHAHPHSIPETIILKEEHQDIENQQSVYPGFEITPELAYQPQVNLTVGAPTDFTQSSDTTLEEVQTTKTDISRCKRRGRPPKQKTTVTSNTLNPVITSTDNKKRSSATKAASIVATSIANLSSDDSDIDDKNTDENSDEDFETTVTKAKLDEIEASTSKACEPITPPPASPTVIITPSKWTPKAGSSRSKTADPSTFETPEEDRTRNLRMYRELRESMFFSNVHTLSDYLLQYYTGLCKPVFIVILEKIEAHITFELNPTQCFILTLMKLKHNFQYTDLGFRFQINRATASRIFHKCIDILYVKLSSFIIWPTPEELTAIIPKCFESYHKGVTVIIDCFEVNIEKSSNPEEAVSTLSVHGNTLKYLIGITPQGLISFISAGYVGRCSDTELTETCGILENLRPGDVVMADRGFHINAAVGLYCAEVVQPAFKRGKKQLHPRDVENSGTIASLRIHVERVIRRVRRSYRIMYDTVPMFFLRELDTDELTTMDKIVVICCALLNLSPIIIKMK